MGADPILGFHGGFRFLSNFADSPITYEGIVYATVEHAFQAAKTADRQERHQVAQETTPGRAKRVGRRLTLRGDWEEVKYQVMLTLVRQSSAATRISPESSCRPATPTSRRPTPGMTGSGV